MIASRLEIQPLHDYRLCYWCWKWFWNVGSQMVHKDRARELVYQTFGELIDKHWINMI